MLRPLVFLSALSIAGPAAATSYSATTAAPAPAKIVARDILWACASGACTGVTEYSRPLLLCQGLAKKAGKIESFLVDGRAIAAAELERCNASAKGDSNRALANVR